MNQPEQTGRESILKHEEVGRMKRALSVLAIAIVCFVMAGTGAAVSAEFPGKIISAQWLQENMDKIPNLKIIDLRKAEDYAQGHIPGAVNIPYGEFRAEVLGVSGMRRPPENWEKMMGRRAGANENDAIVSYTGKNPQEAGRVVWECDYYGHGKAAMLNGGFEAWIKAGGKVTADVPEVAPKYYVIKDINHDVLATDDYVMRNLKTPGVKILDARPSKEFTGEDPGRSITTGGHIPGAVNIPIGDFTTEDGYIKPLEEFEKMVAAKGLKKHDIVVVTCRTGNQSSAAYPALSDLGYKVKNHDSSWLGWNKDGTLPVEK
jgi:thiosulfate/3-mercaptopyruvate sulfurtransferase